MGFRKIGFFAAAFCVFSSQLSAATFDVTNGAELEAALADAQGNGAADTINMAAGNYTSNNPFVYTATSTENFSLTIIGAGADTTIVDGQNARRALQVSTTAVLPNDAGATVTISGLTFQNGLVAAAFEVAAGLFVSTLEADISLSDCVVKLNQVTATDGNTGGAFLFADLGNVSASNCTFDTNESEATGGLRVATNDGEIRVSNNLFTGNISSNIDFGGGGLRLDPRDGPTIIEGNRFFRNETAGSGGGLLFFTSGSGNSQFINNIFFDNQSGSSLAGRGGGGLAYITFGAGPTVLSIVNNTFFSNESSDSGNGPTNGGAIFLELLNGTETQIYNNIVFDNLADGLGDDIYANDDNEDDNTGTPLTLVRNNFSDFTTDCLEDGACTPDVTETDTQLGVDPLFVDPSQDDLHLSAVSPCINEGDPAAPNLPTLDFEGDPRVNGPAPDIGADEQNVCGDGLQGANEGCDDGNTVDGDGCNASCEVEVPDDGNGGGNGGGNFNGAISGGGCSFNPGGLPVTAGAWALFAMLGLSALGLRRR